MKLFKCLFLLCLLLYSLPLLALDSSPKTFHIYVSLWDSPEALKNKLSDGNNLEKNLYWGAQFGVKTFFMKSSKWVLIFDQKKNKGAVAERCIFKLKSDNVYMIADAYYGVNTILAIHDFLNSCSGNTNETISLSNGVSLNIGSSSKLLAYVGHNGLMDFEYNDSNFIPENKKGTAHDVIALACMSRQ